MSATQEPFFISYYGVSTQVTPIVNRNSMRYLVELPTREVLIETRFDEDEIDYWVEVPGGRTGVSEEVGAIIERMEM